MLTRACVASREGKQLYTHTKRIPSFRGSLLQLSPTPPPPQAPSTQTGFYLSDVVDLTNIAVTFLCSSSCVRRGDLGCGEKVRIYLRTSCKCSRCFRFVCSYILTMDGLMAPKPPSQVVDMETCISGSGRVSVSGRNSISGTAPIPRPSRARDLVTMAEVGSARLVSLECVTIWVSDRFHGALGRNLTRSAGRCDFPYLGGAVSITFCPKLLVTDNWKMLENSGNEVTIYITTIAVFSTIQC